MGKILGAYLMPHPPVIIPEVGKGKENKIRKTMDALCKIGENIAQKEPDTIVLISPHGALFKDAIAIMGLPELRGDLSYFNAKDIVIEKTNDMKLAEKLDVEAWSQGVATVLLNEEKIKGYNISEKLDHGAVVPLYFVEKTYKAYQLVHINYGMLKREQLYHFGKIIAESVEAMSKDVVVIASGDLSHKLTKDAPSGYHASGAEFDKKLMDLLREGDIKSILNLEDDFVTEAGECGLRSIDIMMGTLDGWHIACKNLSYEGPFGVGYGTTIIRPTKKSQNRLFLNSLTNIAEEKMDAIRKKEDAFVKLARNALEEYIINKKTIDLPQDVEESLKYNQAGVFVSIKKDGQLRGCIGTTQPVKNCIGSEIIRNSIHSGTCDPRFYPVDKNELRQLVYSVDVLEEPEEIQDKNQLNVKKYGVIVENNLKKGLLLPNLEGVDTTEEQVEIALRKANIKKGEKYKIYRFRVERHK